MERKRLENEITHVSKKGGEEVSANQLGVGVEPAVVMWVKIHGGSWWPAQVCAVLCFLFMWHESNILHSCLATTKFFCGNIIFVSIY